MKSINLATAAEGFRFGLGFFLLSVFGCAALILLQTGALPDPEAWKDFGYCSSVLGFIFFLATFHHYYEARCHRCGHACLRTRHFIDSGGYCGQCKAKIHDTGDLIGLGPGFARFHRRIHELLYSNPDKRIAPEPGKARASLRSQIQRNDGQSERLQNVQALAVLFCMFALGVLLPLTPESQQELRTFEAFLGGLPALAALCANFVLCKKIRCPSCGLDLTGDESAMEFGRCPNCSEPYDETANPR